LRILLLPPLQLLSLALLLLVCLRLCLRLRLLPRWRLLRLLARRLGWILLLRLRLLLACLLR